MITRHPGLSSDPPKRVGSGKGSHNNRLKSIWDQLISSGPILNHSANTKLVYAHHEQGRLFQFLIGLRDEFESAISHILH